MANMPVMEISNNLHPVHYQDLQNSGLSDETIREAKIYSLRPADIPKKLGWNGQGIESLLAFPYPGCDDFDQNSIKTIDSIKEG
jgi:hypothetical protein